MGISAALALLQFGHMLSVRGLAIGALALGFSFTFALPAQSVTVPSLVEPAETKRALALDGVSYNLGRALAPVFSVALFLTVGFGWVFAVNAVSFGFFAVVLLRLRRPERLSRPRTGTGADQPPAGNGFRIAWQDRRILGLLLMVAAVTVASDPITVLGRRWPITWATRRTGRMRSSPHWGPVMCWVPCGPAAARHRFAMGP